MDRISQLPEHLMEKILFCLPAEDAHRTSFLSTTWKSLWNSLPTSRFNLSASEEGSVTGIDESLRILHQHEDQKRIIRYFNLKRLLGEKQVDDSNIDRWIKLVARHYVKELNLEFEPQTRGVQRHSFPPTSLDFGSLVRLSLSGCSLDKKYLIQQGTRFSCLQELRLTDIDLNGIGIVEDFLPRCPSLVALELCYCENINSDFQLLGLQFPKLKHVFLDFIVSQNYKFKIEAVNLERFYYSIRSDELGAPLDLEAINCGNLKELKIRTCNATINQEYVDKICSKFPFLEVLELRVSTLQSPELEISSQQLKEFYLQCENDYKRCLAAVKIDSPNLVKFYSSYGQNISADLPLFSSNSIKLKHVVTHLILEIWTRLDTWWFLRLRQSLGKSTSGTPHHQLTLTYSHVKSSENVFSLEELRSAENIPLPRIIKGLAILIKAYEYSIESEADDDVIDASVIEGLLWSCHPMTLIITAHGHHKKNSKLAKILHEKLLCREDNPTCCGGDNGIKCWRHSLKSIKIRSFSGYKNGQYVSYDQEFNSSSSSNWSLKDVERVTGATFELQWSCGEDLTKPTFL